MFQKKLEYFFGAVVVFFLLFLGNNLYQSYSFKNNPISQEMQDAIDLKEQEILILMQRDFGFVYQFPLIVTDKFPGRLYGVTSMKKDGTIEIYLNKKVMQESFDYMIKSVIAHEYAHALSFKLGEYDRSGDGHSPRWQAMCRALGGVDCQRYVDQDEVVLGKLPF